MYLIVLIESDWNLKWKYQDANGNWHMVLIESDWNLKQEGENAIQMALRRINRIRLEFKVNVSRRILGMDHGINRIRLEFKVLRRFILMLDNFVLIESDWNLK